jgi:hypothetical protein
MPSRLIRDGLLESEAVLGLPVEARWLYLSILLGADDVGLFEATPFRLARRADIRRDHADKLTQMLADADLIRLYSVDGKAFGFIPKYGQRLQIKRARFPLPPVELLRGDQEALNKIKHLGSNPTVGHRDPRKSTVIHRDPPPEPEVEPEKKHLPASASEPSGFAAFWDAWPKSPRKVARKTCALKWQRLKLSSQAQDILRHVEAMKQTKQWTTGYEPAPITYLNGERWRDGLPEDAATTSDGYI